MISAVFDILALGVPHLHSEGPITAGASNALRRVVNGDPGFHEDEVFGLLAQENLRTVVEPGAAAAVAQGAKELGANAAYLACSARGGADSALAGIPAACGIHVLPDLQPDTPYPAHRFSLTDAAGSFTSLRRYGCVTAGRARLSAVLAGSANLLCLEDSLWDVQGGAQLAQAMVAAAQRAGRRTALLCRDPEVVHRNRSEIRRLADRHIDFLMGEVQALVALYDYQRLDSLIPRLRVLERGGVVWRPNHPPLVFDGDILAWRKCEPLPTAAEFWSAVLPEYLVEIARTGSLEKFAPPGPSRRRRAMAEAQAPGGEGGSCA